MTIEHVAESRPRASRAQRNIWDLAILVLGINLWISFLLIPALHQREGATAPTYVLMALALVVLVVGVGTRRWAVLLAGYPAALVVPVVVDPRLVGVNVYSAWTFTLVALGFIAYNVGAALLLRLASPPRYAPTRHDPLPHHRRQTSWRHRRPFYIALATLAALLPAVLVYSLYLRPGMYAELRHYYPERAGVAAVLFGVLALGIWLMLFRFYFFAPLGMHLRGDPALETELLRLRASLRRRRPRAQLALWLLTALAALALLIVRGCDPRQSVPGGGLGARETWRAATVGREHSESRGLSAAAHRRPWITPIVRSSSYQAGAPAILDRPAPPSRPPSGARP